MKEKVLILGGTEFVGRLLVEALRTDQTKEIYLFNRGKTNPGLFPKIKRIPGDRETDDVKKLQAHQWDYVIDFSSYFPKSLQSTIHHINKNVKKYIYISTIAVYDLKGYDPGIQINEDYKKVTCTPEEAVDPSMKTYGNKKLACEEVLNEATWLNAIILRPSIIYGPYDPTDRFYYWLRKIKNSKEIIVPNHGEDLLTLTYADDLVAIIQQAIYGDLPMGVYNCNTHDLMTLKSMLEIMKNLLGSRCQFYGMDREELKKEGISFPVLYVRNLMLSNSRIKEAAGLKFTSFEESVKRLIGFYEREGWQTCRIGMKDGLEKEIIGRDRGLVGDNQK